MNVRRLLRALLLPVLSLLLSLQVLAQNKTITGRVTGNNGTPVAGATVAVKGTTTVTTTKDDGSFSIAAAPDAVLVFTSVGYERRDITVGAGSEVNVALTTAAGNLGEVVVVGYGTQRRREVTGAISKVDGGKIASVPAPSFESALAGKAAGVQISTNSGTAGSGATVRVRGVGSIVANGDPLYVIDGIPMSVDYFTNGDALGNNRNPLASINPNDIESVEILKDAGAAGIYGSRGANGVILITTKRGRGKPSLNFTSRVGFVTYTRKPEFVDKNTWLALRQEAWELDGNTGVQRNLPGREGGFSLAEAQAAEPTDWWKEATQVGVSHNYNLSYSRALRNWRTFLGGTYSKDESYIKDNSFDRLALRFNNDYKFSNKLSVMLNLAVNKGVNNLAINSFNGGLGLAMGTGLPFYPVRNADGTWFESRGAGLTWNGLTGGDNLVKQRENSNGRIADVKYIGNFALDYKPLENLSFRGTFSTDFTDSKFDQLYRPDYYLDASPLIGVGQAYRNHTRYNNYNGNITGTYNLKLGAESKLTILAGAEFQREETRSANFRANDGFRNVTDPLYKKGQRDAVQDSLDNPAGGWNTSYERRFASAFSRLNYVLKDRYVLQASARVDGASVFRENNKYGFFPTISGAWIISDEAFLSNNRLINNLKLRASYGLTGNSNIDWIAGYRTYNVNPSDLYGGQGIIFQNNLGNPNLKWETADNYDVAIEFALFNNRISGEIAYYNKLTKDVLLNFPLNAYNGQGSQMRNIGEVFNEGLEFSLNTVNVQQKNFSWRTNFNIASNYNEVRSIGGLGPDALSSDVNETRIVAGYPIGTVFTLNYYGVDPADGLPLWRDRNGKLTKTPSINGPQNDRQPVGTLIPRITGGFTNTFTYKQFELNTLFTYQFGGHIWDNSGKRQWGWMTDWNVRADYVGNYWRQPGDVAKYPRPTLVGYPGFTSAWDFSSDMFFYKSDFVRLRELTLAYNLPTAVASRMKIQNARVYFTGYNLFLFTEYPNGDPELTRELNNAQSRNMSAYTNFLTAPQQMSFNLGLNLTF